MDADDENGFDINDTPEKRALRTRLLELKEEHRALDSAIFALQEQCGGDALQLARLKKRKLVLRDQIQWIEDRLMPWRSNTSSSARSEPARSSGRCTLIDGVSTRSASRYPTRSKV